MWDGFPVSPGHALIVPRRHAPGWFDATSGEQQELMTSIELVRNVIEEKYRPDGFNIGINVGASAGQTVPHLHVHVIPRYSGDVGDPRGGVRHVIPGKGNYLSAAFEAAEIGDRAGDWGQRTQGGIVPLFRSLADDLARADGVDFAVAFVLCSGLDHLEPHLYEIVNRGGHLRLLTGDYLNVTEPEALQRLLDLQQYADNLSALAGRVECRVFETDGSIGFHPKAYLVRRSGELHTAYVGSSNISHSALLRGIEWNHRVTGRPGESALGAIAGDFETLFGHHKTVPLSAEWIASYRARRPARESSANIVPIPDEDQPAPPPEPHSIQKEALEALEETRRAGHRAGLVVLATGLGKTWLSAFDSAEFKRVLFVAHREEILRQALATFRRIRPAANLGYYTGDIKDHGADILFASVQTLGRAAHLGRFEVDAFDYIIVDEFHHAAARTYRQLIDYFEPAFLLGLTATPDRTDGAGLLALCGENLVYRCDVVDGIDRELLSPFKYFGVPDSVDFENIPWRSGRFDPDALEHAVATEARAANALEQWKRRKGSRGIGFCVSQRHADYMAEFFRARGLRALAVHAGATSAPRSRTLENLEKGDLDIVFAVDMFNEGVDVPHVDTILMLRPTESRILWQQQFGRGLRRAEGKSHVRVIDYIGNHRVFLQPAMLLLPGATAGVGALHAALEQLEVGELELPPGCEITYDLEALNILKKLSQPRTGVAAVRAWYQATRERHGMRPTAAEAWHTGYDPRLLRKGFGSWLGFARSEGDLDESQVAAFEANREFLGALEVTPMVRSYKMLVLLAMLSRSAFPGSIQKEELIEAVRHHVKRSPLLIQDFGIDVDDDARMATLLETNPIEAWVEGRGTNGTAYFGYDGDSFRTRLSDNPDHAEALAEMTREICEYRLAQYLERLHGATRFATRIVCNVSHSGGRPILFLPNRDSTPGIPEGETPIVVDGRDYVASFAKIAVNVVGEPGESSNVLPDLLRKWFGEDAGLPGKAQRVMFEYLDDRYVLRPIGDDEQRPTLWGEYLRPEIPPLWGLEFNPGRWNQGYVAVGDHVFLLVSLDKTGLQQLHQYEEGFESPELFRWSSPNSAARSGAIGRKLQSHREKGVDVHLFVRPTRKTPDGKAARYTYCGEVEFVDWRDDKPIHIDWQLRSALPDFLHKRFGLG